jgi:hypothetical protein
VKTDFVELIASESGTALGHIRAQLREEFSYVNSKNSFGGHTGMQPFFAEIKSGRAPVLDGPYSEAAEVGIVIKMCREDGLEI